MNIEVFTAKMIDAFAQASFILTRAVGDVNVMLTAFQAMRMAALADHGEASQVFVDAVLNHESYAKLASNGTIMNIALFDTRAEITMADKAHLWKTALSMLYKITYVDGGFNNVPVAEAVNHVSVYIDADGLDRPKTVMLAGSLGSDDHIETFATVNSWGGDPNYLRVQATPENAAYIERVIDDLTGHYTTDHIADMIHFMTVNRTEMPDMHGPQPSPDTLKVQTMFLPDAQRTLILMAMSLASRVKLRISNEDRKNVSPKVRLVYEVDNLAYPMGLKYGRGSAFETLDPRVVIAANGAASSTGRLMLPPRFVSMSDLASVVVHKDVLKTQRNYKAGSEGKVRDKMEFDMIDERLVISQEDPLSATGLKTNRTDAMIDIPNRRAICGAIWDAYVHMLKTVTSEVTEGGEPIPTNPVAVQQVVEWTTWLLHLGGNPWTGDWAGASYTDELAQRLLDRALMRAGNNQEQSKFYRALRAREHSLEYRIIYKLHMLVHCGLLEKTLADNILEILQKPVYSGERQSDVSVITLLGRAQFGDTARAALNTAELIARASESVQRR
jgi:hypothetical protein